MLKELTNQQWQQYQEQGFIKLGKVISDEQMDKLRQRIDDIMLGKASIDYDKMLMQLDSESGDYDKAGTQSKGHKGATLGYRKIQDLEFDPLFLEYMQLPIFKDICARVYGGDVDISCFRAMFMNKPSNKGTFLPWHQDRWTKLDRDPLLTIYTALDAATKENGCVQYIPESHKLGILNPEHSSGFLTEAQAEKYCAPEKREYLELEQGEVALLHNWLLHGSDVNRSANPRKAFSVCCMDGKTRTVKDGKSFPVIFGQGALVSDTIAV